MNITQLRVGGFDNNLSYLLYEEKSREAAVIDPAGDTAVIREEIKAHAPLVPCYILLTHGHHDHANGLGKLRAFFDAPVAAHPACPYTPDIALKNHQIMYLGESGITSLYTPGHTRDSITYHLTDDTALFTGDTLFIDWCGYCEPETMFRTMRDVLYPLADSNEVYPGHDYGRKPHAPLGEEKRRNPYLSTDDFQQFCKELKRL